MTVYVQDTDFTLYHGDAIDVLRSLDAASVHCCVTSPPYWGLRDYGHDGQIGLEPPRRRPGPRQVQLLSDDEHGTLRAVPFRPSLALLALRP